MKAALLSAGPSLRQCFPWSERFDVRIGVNAAASAAHCDYWACGDAQTFEEVAPLGFPVVFTLDDQDGRLRHNRRNAARLAQHRVMGWNEVRDRVHPPAAFSNWSITAALALAVDLGITELHVYGHDMDGVVDCQGRAFIKRRENWKRVGTDWLTVSAWARERGVRIHHHTPGNRTACTSSPS